MKKGSMHIKKIAGVTIVVGLSACSTVKDMTNVDLWPFSKSAEQGQEYQPANSTPYVCNGNKKFYVRYLERGASVWLILPDREVALPQVGTSKIYSNGVTKLDLSSDNVSLEVNEATQYVACKANSPATMAKADTAKPASQAASASTTQSASKESSEKGWFDWMKFWESEEKAKPAAAEIKPVEKAKVAEPQPAAPKVEAAPVPEIKLSEPATEMAEAKSVEPVKAEPIVASEPEVAKEAVAAADVAAPKAEMHNDHQAAVAKAVEAWAAAWRGKNVEAYLASYSPKFKPQGMSKKAWEAQRKQRVGANAGEISLSLDKVTIEADAKKAKVSFNQHYASGKYSDDVMKVLSFENVKGQWLIVKETAKVVSSKK